MKQPIKAVISVVLVIAMLAAATIPTFAVDGEEYLCELRLIYAEDYSEAQDILDDSEFYDYELLEENLNSNTGEIGVWLAYKTTTDIEDAITDIAVIEMDGGYREGNYQEMIKQSYAEYVRFGEIYLKAIAYMMDAYKAGSFPAKAAYRQLNFFTLLDNETSFNGMLLGDIFARGITSQELATIFMEGNSNVLNNVRSLIAMGVTYNADGKTYLEKVIEEAAKYEANAGIYDAEMIQNFEQIAVHVSAALYTYNDMFRELKNYESQLNYEDDNITELEIQYAEHKAIADMMRKVDYLNGKTLYEFCLEEGGNLDIAHERLYPLIAALNEGQNAMAMVGHYYDVVRYSLKDFPEEMMNDQIDDLEEIYSIAPFNVYHGVDRSIYDGSFALTSEAYRTSANTEEGLASYLFNNNNALMVSMAIAGGVIGVGLSVWAIIRTEQLFELGVALEPTRQIVNETATFMMKNAFELADKTVANTYYLFDRTYNDMANILMAKYYPRLGDPSAMAYMTKMSFLETKVGVSSGSMAPQDALLVQNMVGKLEATRSSIRGVAQTNLQNTKDVASYVFATNKAGVVATGALYLLGGALMIYSAVTLALTINDYYNPEYTAIPVAMVDLIDTPDGDRYIKYDAVYEVEGRKYHDYVPGDLNAFEGQRWNALYYTKSYEAGSPLLASFTLNYDSNVPKEDYAPVHRFGEVVCYNLNKYNFDSDSDTIYLSVEQSEHQKSAVADVPELVGSMVSSGWVFLAGGIGLAAGIAVTVGTQLLYKEKKNKSANEGDT